MGEFETPDGPQTPHPIEGPAQNFLGFQEGLRSVLVWGGVPQGLGILFTMIWKAFEKSAPEVGGLLMISTGPLFVMALFFAVLRVIFFEFREKDVQVLRGGRTGFVIFLGIWLITSLSACAWTWSRIQPF